MMKTLERLVDRHVKDNLLLRKPLHVPRLEWAVSNRELVMGLIIDIVGEFDNKSFESMKHGVQERGITSTLNLTRMTL